jgi:hypothetical protein
MIRTPMGTAIKNAGAGRRWPLIIVGLISMNMCIVATTVVCANMDKSFAVEPDYYKKAVEWDRTARERDRGQALGWDVSVSLAEPKSGETAPLQPVLRVVLNSTAAPGSAPLDGAQVLVEAFPQARSSQRVNLIAQGVGGGVYEIGAPINRAGVWEVRLRIKRGPDAISFVRTLIVPGPVAAKGGGGPG